MVILKRSTSRLTKMWIVMLLVCSESSIRSRDDKSDCKQQAQHCAVTSTSLRGTTRLHCCEVQGPVRSLLCATPQCSQACSESTVEQRCL